MAERSDTEPGTDWAKLARRALTAICAIGAVTASFIFLTDLARQNGWPYWAAPLLPLCIDALGGMALLRYREGIKDAGWVALAAIAASFAGNALSHLYATGVMEPGWVSIAVIGGIPALSLGLCVHLTTRKETNANAGPAAVDQPVGGDTGDTADAHTDGTGGGGGGNLEPSKRRRLVEPTTTPAARIPAHRSPPARRGTRTDEELAQTVRLERWQTLSGDELAERLHVAKGRALRVRALSVSDGNGKVAADAVSN